MAQSAKSPEVAALIVAGGKGVRAGGEIPKQYQSIGGRPVIARTLDAFLAHERVDTVLAVIGAEDAERYARIAPQHDKLLAPAIGGPTRQESVRRGLAALASDPPRIVLIHDAVRPFVSAATITAVVDALQVHPGALPAVPVTDTLQRADAAGIVSGVVERAGLFAAETPQGFAYAAIVAAHARAAAERRDYTDDVAVASAAGMAVKLVPGGGRDNPKLTTPEDIRMADERLRAAFETRTGTGYDVHALGPGKGVMLGGVFIPHDRALIGHSDADVALHALTDAILGALADGDIGAHFPPSDATLKGASSDRFLAFAAARVAARGGCIVHLDVSLIAEAPKIGPHRDAMRHRIAAIAGVGVDRVAVKATTNERLGFIGRGEGIAALATATLALPVGPV